MRLVELDPVTKQLLVRFSGADFQEGLDIVRGLPREDRSFNSTTKVWFVKNTEKNIGILRRNRFRFQGFNTYHSAEGQRYHAVPTPGVPVETSLLPKEILPYQLRGVEFLEAMQGRGAGIFDDQGLGKTLQAIGYMLLHPEVRPVLIIPPKSVKINWQRELLKWGSRNSHLWPHGIYDAQGTFILNYDQLVKYKQELIDFHFALVIADEIQYIKSPKTQRTKAFVEIVKSIPKKIFLSGTPIENKPREFWTVLHLLNPQEFNNQRQFLNTYCGPDFNGATNIEELHARLSSFTIRRLKKDVLTELPPKQKFVVSLELNEVDGKTFEHDDEEFQRWTLETSNKLGQQQYVQHLLQRAYQAKRDSLLEWVRDFLSTGKKLVLFGYHKEVLLDLERSFPEISVRVDGSVTGEQRQEAVDRFQKDPQAQLFIGQLLAAGVGLTLTAASTVAFVQLWYVPAKIEQAEDRLHRIGARENVQVYYLTAAGTVEDDMAYVLAEKYKVVKAVLDGREDSEFFDQDFLSLVLQRRKENRNGK